MVVRAAGWIGVLALVLASPRQVAAMDPSEGGLTWWALPGVHRVGIAGPSATGLGVAGTAGYGYTEAQAPGDGAHHRVFGRVAAALVPTPSLALALALDGRHDRHPAEPAVDPDEESGAYGGSVGDPRLLARYGAALGDAARLGGELVLWMPGDEAPSLVPAAATVDASLLFAWVPKAGPRVATRAGFRLDNSAEAAPDLARLREGDRIALGLSGSNAVLVGAGIGVPLGSTELLGEVTWDVAVGADAPGPMESPLRISAGARHAFSRALALEVLTEVTPSSRPSQGVTAPLAPIEPRVSVMAGLRFRLPFEDEPAPGTAPPPDVSPPVEEEPEATPTVAVSVIQVTDPDGQPVEGKVTVRVGEWTREAARAEDGTYRVEGVPAGEGTITVAAEGFPPVEQPATFGPGAPPSFQVKLAPPPPTGQLRGLVRSFAGKGIRATIRVEPLGLEVKSDPEGAFTLDVPPGEYQVVISAERFTEQRRKIKVDDNGVTVLNAELFEARR